MTLEEFQADIRAGIPDILPEPKPYDTSINHAPRRKDILTPAEKEMPCSRRSSPKSCADTAASTCTACVPTTTCTRIR